MRATYFLKIPRSVLNLELSSGAFSTGAFEGVPARDGSLELSADAVAELGWAFSAGRSAMAAGASCFSCGGGRGRCMSAIRLRRWER